MPLNLVDDIGLLKEEEEKKNKLGLIDDIGLFEPISTQPSLKERITKRLPENFLEAFYGAGGSLYEAYKHPSLLNIGKGALGALTLPFSPLIAAGETFVTEPTVELGERAYRATSEEKEVPEKIRQISRIGGDIATTALSFLPVGGAIQKAIAPIPKGLELSKQYGVTQQQMQAILKEASEQGLPITDDAIRQIFKQKQLPAPATKYGKDFTMVEKPPEGFVGGISPEEMAILQKARQGQRPAEELLERFPEELPIKTGIPTSVPTPKPFLTPPAIPTPKVKPKEVELPLRAEKEALKGKIPSVETKVVRDLLKGQEGFLGLPSKEQIKEAIIPMTPERRQRQFLKTVSKSPRTAPELQAGLAGLEQKYTIYPNKEALSFADELITKDIDEAIKFTQSEAPFSANKGATIVRVLDKLQAEGKYDKAVEYFDLVEPQFREAGRMIQTASIWNKLTPMGFVKWAEKTVDKAAANNYVRDLTGRIRLTPEDKAFLLQKVTEAYKLPEGIERNKIIVSAIDNVAKKIPPSANELIDAYRRTNMLSGWQTQGRNIGENIFNTFITRPYDLAVKSGVDFVGANLSGKERQTYLKDMPTYLKNVINAFPRAIEAFKQAMRFQVDIAKPELGLEGKSLLQQARFKRMPKALTFVDRFMEASDRFNTTLITAGQYAINKSHGMVDDIAVANAKSIAETYLYRNSLKLTKDDLSIASHGLKGLGEIVLKGRQIPYAGRVLSWFVPFITTPINKGIQMIERTPLALARTNFSKENMAKIIGGGLVTAYGAYEALNNNTTWSAPTDPTEKAMYYATGRKPYSIKIGDNWVSMWYTGPFALAFALPAMVKYHFQDSKKGLSESNIRKTTKVAEDIGRFIGSQSSAQSIGNFFKMMSGDMDYTSESQLAFTIKQFLPLSGLSRNINYLVDPVYRKPETFLQQLYQDYPPGVGTGILPRRQPMGELATREPIGEALAPYGIRKVNPEYEKEYEPFTQQRKINYIQNKIEYLRTQVQKGLMSPEQADNQFKILIENYEQFEK